jgi:hypothetical protein
MPPGWYDDPWSPAAYRWWDGSQWTAHTSPRAVPYYRLTPDLEGTARWARFAKIAVVATAVLACVELVLSATLLHSIFHNLFHQLHEYSKQLDADPNAQPHFNLHIGRIYEVDAASLVGFIPEIVFIVWFAKAATSAERLGLPHVRSQIWAILGFFVPIVNFWFPYQVARDLLPPDDPRRRLAGWWWGLTLGQAVPGLAVFIVSFSSETAALLLAVVAFALPVAVAVNARRLIDAVTERHAALAAG